MKAAIALAGVLFCHLAAISAGQPADTNTGRSVSAADVERAIAKAKDYLYAQQHNGNWEQSQTKQPTGGIGPMAGRGEYPETSSQWGGLSSIATFALMSAGDRETDERLTKAILFLKGGDITGTYALGLHAQVWTFMQPDRVSAYKAGVWKDGNILLKDIHKSGEARGLYHYTPDDPGWDNSTAQFGVLGMWACAQMGFEVPLGYWKEVEDAWIRHQDKTGGWSYGGGMGMGGPGPGMGGPGVGPGGPGGGRGPGMGPPGGGVGAGAAMGPGGGMGGGPPGSENVKLSMTAAGVATLFITQDYLHSDSGCNGNFNNLPIEAGIKWVSQHFNELTSEPRHYFYTLFGISRIGLAGGYKYFGTTDWYKEGAAQLVGYQRADGSWGDGVADTSFALLFLTRGRAPVVMNKLEYALNPPNRQPVAGNWNQRARDAANVARWVGRAIERQLNWQVVNLSVDPAELHDAPILYIAGNQSLSFTPAEEDKLRLFVQQGGMILGNADCGNRLFSDGFKKLGSRLFKKYEFRALPPDHIIYTGELAKPGKKQPVPLEGLSNGCRELMILIPGADPARYWQTRADVGHLELYQILANIYLYSVERSNARYKGDSYIVLPNSSAASRGSIKLARLIAGDNPDPEPGGWVRLSAVMHNQYGTDLTTEAVPLGEGKLDGFTIAHWTGTTKVMLTDAQRDELKKFIAAGGTLVVDAAGGTTRFSSTAEAELVKTFSADPSFAEPLPLTHPLFSAGSQKITAVAYRRFARDGAVGKLTTPRLRGIAVNNRLAVVFSAEDLSEGIVGEPIDGIIGYEPDSATALMGSILEYAAVRR